MTGVQTCALPIFEGLFAVPRAPARSAQPGHDCNQFLELFASRGIGVHFWGSDFPQCNIGRRAGLRTPNPLPSNCGTGRLSHAASGTVRIQLGEPTSKIASAHRSITPVRRIRPRGSERPAHAGQDSDSWRRARRRPSRCRSRREQEYYERRRSEVKAPRVWRAFSSAETRAAASPIMASF